MCSKKIKHVFGSKNARKTRSTSEKINESIMMMEKKCRIYLKRLLNFTILLIYNNVIKWNFQLCFHEKILFVHFFRVFTCNPLIQSRRITEVCNGKSFLSASFIWGLLNFDRSFRLKSKQSFHLKKIKFVILVNFVPGDFLRKWTSVFILKSFCQFFVQTIYLLSKLSRAVQKL